MTNMKKTFQEMAGKPKTQKKVEDDQFNAAKAKAELNKVYDQKLKDLETGVNQKRITLGFALARAMTYGIEFVSGVGEIEQQRIENDKTPDGFTTRRGDEKPASTGGNDGWSVSTPGGWKSP